MATVLYRVGFETLQYSDVCPLDGFLSLTPIRDIATRAEGTSVPLNMATQISKKRKVIPSNPGSCQLVSLDVFCYEYLN